MGQGLRGTHWPEMFSLPSVAVVCVCRCVSVPVPFSLWLSLSLSFPLSCVVVLVLLCLWPCNTFVTPHCFSTTTLKSTAACHRSHFGSRYTLGCCGHAGLFVSSSIPSGCMLHDPQAEKAGSTRRCSRAVPHPSTNRALCGLTSEVRRDPVYSTRYGRQRYILILCIFWARQGGGRIL